MIKKLNKIFWILTSIAAALFGIDFLLFKFKIPITLPGVPVGILGLLFLVLSAAFGIAFPILIRALFQTRAAKRKHVSFTEMEVFQVKLVVIPLIAAFSADLACLFIVPTVQLYGSVLASLYGIYSAIPVRRKIMADFTYYGLRTNK